MTTTVHLGSSERETHLIRRIDSLYLDLSGSKSFLAEYLFLLPLQPCNTSDPHKVACNSPR